MVGGAILVGAHVDAASAAAAREVLTRSGAATTRDAVWEG